MTSSGDRVGMLEGNIALSRGHIAKQNVIVARLTAQGHAEMAEQATSLLATMHQHLEQELQMLARMNNPK